MPEQDPRFTKIDEAIQRLAAIAGDISKMMAVHEQRITQQEKFIEAMNGMMEKRGTSSTRSLSRFTRL